MSGNRTLHFNYESGAVVRLDKLLLERLASAWEGPLTRSQLKLLIESGNVRINGEVVSKAGSSVRPKDNVSIALPEPQKQSIEALDIPLKILFEDKYVVVLDKPSGLSMHPGAGNKKNTLVNALVHHFGKNKPELFRNGIRPGIVHRLDRDTTGVVVVAKTAAVHADLAKQFSSRSVGREYLALALSMPRGLRALNQADEGEFASNLGRDPRERKRMAVVEKGGKSAKTHWKVIERMNYACLLRVRLETGRTHQIRVHMTHLGAPLIGDQTYGNLSMLPPQLKIASEKFGRQALHAYKLEFTHPQSGKRLKFEAALPADFEKLLKVFRSGARK